MKIVKDPKCFCPGFVSLSDITVEKDSSQSMLRMMLVKEEASVYRDYCVALRKDESNSPLLPGTLRELLEELQSLLSI